MKRWFGWVVAAVFAVGLGAFAWLFFLAGGSGEPSTELTTPELAGTTTTTSDADTSDGSDSSTTTAAAVATGDKVAYEIDQNASTASFELGEVLRGNPQQVVGTTDQVAGQFAVDVSDLSTVEFSDIVINARTFVTNSSTRDRQIRGPVILNSASDEHEFITFTVTSFEGLSGSASVGDTFEFTITGDLTIRDTTARATFDVSVTLADESTIEGTATTEVLRDDFGIGIPSVSSVADVTNEVTLSLVFVARTG